MRKTLLVAVIGLAALSVIASLGMAQQKGKVLMIVNEGKSEDLELMLTKEVGVMKDLLQRAGFEVVVATASNQPMAAGSAKLKLNLKLGDVKVANYKGVIMPCMATSGSPLPPEGTAIIKEAVAKGKPLAAQTGSVVLLSQAGVLKGKKYALAKGWLAIEGAIYSGDGIVQDGKIITSGVCPYMAKSQGMQAQGMQDGTSKLTEALIAELKK
jgi:putative intracellular protease/amidase